LQSIKSEKGIYQDYSFFKTPICALQIFDLCLVSVCISGGGKQQIKKYPGRQF
jgi:hypothetical protein